jgi:hypothetical protein
MQRSGWIWFHFCFAFIVNAPQEGTVVNEGFCSGREF